MSHSKGMWPSLHAEIHTLQKMGAPRCCLWYVKRQRHWHVTMLVPNLHLSPPNPLIKFAKAHILSSLSFAIESTIAKSLDSICCLLIFFIIGSGKLCWTASKLCTEAVFLGLKIKINPSSWRVETSSYFKPMNLFLYIPPKSTHPPGCLKGMLYGQLRRFWLKNSQKSDYCCAVHHFFSKLVACGHSHLFLTRIFLESAKKLDKAQKPKQEKDVEKTIFSTANTTPMVFPEPKSDAFSKKHAPVLLPTTGWL